MQTYLFFAFFAAFDGMEEGFKQRAQMVETLLADDRTAFVLVASPRRDTVEEAAYFADRLADMRLSVRAVVVNRIYPFFGSGLADELAVAARSADADGPLADDVPMSLARFGVPRAELIAELDDSGHLSKIPHGLFGLLCRLNYDPGEREVGAEPGYSLEVGWGADTGPVFNLPPSTAQLGIVFPGVEVHA